MRFWRMMGPRLDRPIDGIHAFYVNGMLRSMVIAMIGIFTPVYVYKLGLAEWGIKEGVVLVAGYYFVTRLVTLTCGILASRAIEKIGFRRSVLISFLLLGLHLSLLIASENNLNLLPLSALALGLNVPFYWISRNAAIAQDGDRKKVGVQMGWMMTLEHLATMLGPLAAGLIIEKWGFNVLFLTTMAILALSIVPLWSMVPHLHKNGASLRGFWYYITSRRYFHLGVGIGSRAVDDYAMAVLWPLAIFILGIKTSVLGGLFSLVSLLSLGIRLLVSKVFDKLRGRGDFADEALFSVAAIGGSILWVARLFVTTISAILAVDLVGAFFGTTYSTMFVDYEQLGGMRMGNIAYWVYGEMLYSIMAMGLMTLVAIGAYLNVWRELAFLSASFWLLTSIVMARESNMR